MRKWIVVVAMIAIGLTVLFALRNNRSVREQAQSAIARQAPSQKEGRRADKVQSTVAARGDQDLGGIDVERKRRIVNAASACARVDSFREMAAREAGDASNNGLASLSEVQLRNFEEAERQCSADPAARTAPVDEFMVDLARGGNMAAAACYIVGSFHPKRHGVAPPDDPTYRQLVPELIERGVAAGDWRIISVAASVHGPRQAGSVFTYLPPPNPEMNFVYVKMLELGATAEEKAELQAVLVEMGKELSPAERKRAEDRAESLFRAHFAQAPAYSRGKQSLCVGF